MIVSLSLVLTLAAPDPAIIELKAGVEAFQADRYADALRKLKRFEPDARRLGEEALTYWHIARSMEELKRPCDALTYFEKTAIAPQAPTDKVAPKVKALRGSLRAGLRAECATPGTSVRLKGREGELSCPGEWTELKPGRYTVIARIGGRDFAPVQTDTKLCATQIVNVEAAGALQIGSPTPGAEVMVDSVVVGAAPQRIDPIPAGRYLVEVRAPGHATARRQATVESGGTYAHEIALEPAPGIAAQVAPPPAHSQSDTRVGAWLATSAAVVVAGAGGTFLWLSRESTYERDDLREAYNAETEPDAIEEKRLAVLDKDDEISTRQNVGFGLLAGGVALGGLATWLFLRDDSTVAFVPTPGGAYWSLRW